MASKTYVRRFGKGGQCEQRVTVDRSPGLVMEMTFDDAFGAGPVQKHRTSSPRKTFREIERALFARGYEEVTGE